MSSLTNQLREDARVLAREFPYPEADNAISSMRRAADRIEALEAVLAEVEATRGRQEDPASVIRHLSSLARVVLAAGAAPNNETTDA